MLPLTELQGQVIAYILQCLDHTGMPPTLREIAAHFDWKAVGSAQDVVHVLRKKGFLLPPNPGKSRQLVPTPEAVEWWLSKSSNVTASGASRLLWNTLKDRTPLGLTASEVSGSSSQSRVPRAPSPEQPACLFVPVIGLVQAGSPIEAIEHARTTVPFLNLQKKSSESHLFAVAVDGYSMMNVGFLPGDYLLVESATTARNGEIVVAAVGDHEVTVKRFAMRGSQLYRQAHEHLMHTSKRPFETLPPALLVPENNDFAAIPFGMNDSDKIIGLVRSLYRQDVN
jgi:repressor LexA